MSNNLWGHPFLMLEHVNINCGTWTPILDTFYFDVLGCSRDPRASIMLGRMARAGGVTNDLVWANIGLQQIHLPSDSPQAVRGIIGLTYPRLDKVIKLLDDHNYPYNLCDKFDGEEILSTGTEKICERGGPEKLERFQGRAVELTCPVGNRFRLHEKLRENREITSFDTVLDVENEINGASKEVSWYGPLPYIRPCDTGEEGVQLPGGRSDGLGMEYIQFDVEEGTAEGIARFYSTYFGANAAVIPCQKCENSAHQEADQSAAEPPSTVLDSILPSPPLPTRKKLLTCIVRIGHAQQLLFKETRSPVPPYDGHHIALYATDFLPSYERIRSAMLNFNNPRFPQFCCQTLERVLEHQEFRVLRIVDPASGRLLYELEHEIRSIKHPSFSCAPLVTCSEQDSLIPDR